MLLLHRTISLTIIILLVHRTISLVFPLRNNDKKEKKIRRCFFKLLASGHLEARLLAATCDRKLCGDQQPVLGLNYFEFI